jgi:hypothetical protein
MELETHRIMKALQNNSRDGGKAVSHSLRGKRGNTELPHGQLIQNYGGNKIRLH